MERNAKILPGLESLVVPIDSIVSMKGNPRRGDVEAVAKSLKRFGQHRPLVVQESTNEVLIGNHTHKAAISLGWTHIAVLFTDDDRETALARSLADNQTHEAGTYDTAELAAMIAEAAEADDTLLADAGFADDEIEALLAVATADTYEPKRRDPAAPKVERAPAADPGEIRVERVTAKERQETELAPRSDETGESHLFIGDCLDVMATFPDNSVDSVVTDPLGGTGEEGSERWIPDPVLWAEMMRVLKPGGHAAVMAGTTTWHRVAVAMEDAGLQFRDTLMWLFSHGMTHGLDIGQAVDRKTGGKGDPYFKKVAGMSDAAREAFLEEMGGDSWYGWSTELKPAWKPILLFRKKPTGGSVAANVIAHSVGAINIDGCRVGNEERAALVGWVDRKSDPAAHGYNVNRTKVSTGATSLGRWPSNVIADEEVHVDLGDSSRYFLCAGAAKSEKNAGLPPGKTNDHKQPKPVSLTSWLCRLITPPGGVVMDPFCGSGTTGVAAVSQGFGFVGIDMNEHYMDDIAKYRIAAAARPASRK